VVVALGVTTRLLPTTAPMLGLMLRLVAPLTDQERVLLWPAVRVDGLAAKLEMTGAVCVPVTVMVVEAERLPFELDAVRV